MEFVHAGYTQKEGIRRLKFERVEADRSRSAYSVDVDLALLREYHVTLQELPLMCRRLLQNCDEADTARSLSISREHLRAHAAAIEAARAAHKSRVPPRRPRPPGAPLGIRPLSTSGPVKA